MRRVILAAVIGIGTFGIAGAAQAHDHWCGPPVHHPYRAAYFYGPPVVYAPAPVYAAPAYAAYPQAPVAYPNSSVSFFGRNFALRFGF